MERKVATYNLAPSKQVIHVAKEQGDGLGYDILSYDEMGNEKYIEVKTTTGSEKSCIYITANELERSKLLADQYYLYRVYNFNTDTGKGDISIRKGSLEKWCKTAYIYKAEFK